MNTRNHPQRKRYIPALSYSFLTPLFGVFARLTREHTFKRRLLDGIRGEGVARILDIGCGTGTLVAMAGRAFPSAQVVGLDGDRNILARICRGDNSGRGNIEFVLGMAYVLPFAEGSVDAILSSLVFHHLSREDKMRTLREAKRVLRSGGELRIADLGKPGNPGAFAISLVMRRLEEAADGIQGRLPAMMQEAGFNEVGESDRFMTVFGSLSIYRATKAGVPGGAG